MCDKMENYKISFGKYETKSVHVMVKDKTYCKWFLKEVKNRDELKDYIINYKKYCKQIEQNKIIKLNENKIKMVGFNFFKLPNDILRKIFFMSKQMQYNDMLIKINLKYEKQLQDKLYSCNDCLCCGRRTKNDYKYCYECNMEMSKQLRDKRTKRRIKYLTEQNESQNKRELIKNNLKWWFTQVIPKLKKVETECNKPLCVVRSNSGELKVGYMSYYSEDIGLHYKGLGQYYYEKMF
jgi:hypothetical protein